MSSQVRPRLSTAARVRLFALHEGLCHICGCRIDGVRERWEIVVPRGLIGQDADRDANMRPAHARCHAPKSAKDIGDIARAKRRHAKHTGAFRPKHPMPGSRLGALRRRMDGTVVRRDLALLRPASAGAHA